jgi:hypothetical protein
MVAEKLNFTALLSHAKGKIGENPKLTLIVVFCFIMAIPYFNAWNQSTESSTVKLESTQQKQATPFEGSIATNAQFDDLTSHQLAIVNFLNEENQNAIVQIALAFENSATLYTQMTEQKCTGKSVIECLETFKESRVKKLKLLSSSNPPSANELSDNARLSQIHQIANVERELMGIMLAIAVNTPPETRSSVDQEVISSFAPRLNGGLKLADLNLRPQTAIGLIAKEDELKRQLSVVLQENNVELQECLQKTPEEQQKVGGCYGQ